MPASRLIGISFFASDDAPETASENRFRNVDAPYVSGEGDGDTRRRGVVTAIRDRQIRRQSRNFGHRGGAAW
jgi:NADPH-dependent stearoyl-CoA 9-desaturase